MKTSITPVAASLPASRDDAYGCCGGAETMGEIAKRSEAPLEDPTRTLALVLWHE